MNTQVTTSEGGTQEFGHIRRLCWIDDLRYAIRLTRYIIPIRGGLYPILIQDPLVSAVVLTLLIYSVFIIPLVISGQGRLAGDFPITIGAIGVGWSLFFYWIGSHRYSDYLDLLEKSLEEKQLKAYADIKKQHLASMSNDRAHFAVSVPIWLGGSVIVGLEMYGLLPTRLLGVFPPEWSSHDMRLYRLLTIWLIGLIGTLLAWTLGKLIIRHTFFLGRISYLDYLPSQHIYFLCVRPLFRINLLAAFGWSLGIAIVGLLFRNSYTTLRVMFLGVLGTVPAIAFFWPTWLFQEKLREIGIARVDRLVLQAVSNLELAYKDPSRWPEVFVFEEQITKQTTDISFAIAWRYGAYLLTSFVIPVVIALIGKLLERSIGHGTP